MKTKTDKPSVKSKSPEPVKRKRGNPNGKLPNSVRIANLKGGMKPGEIKQAEKLVSEAPANVIELSYLLWRETVKPSDGLSAMQRRALECAVKALGQKAADRMKADMLASNQTEKGE